MLLVLFKKFLGKRQSHQAPQLNTESPEEKVMRIQAGDVKLRNEFITDYQPYVAKMTSRFCKRYIDPAKDDEFSIALGAFNEAISQFSTESGRSFLSFAETVVRRRLIDYVRKEQRFTGQIPLSSFDVQDEEDNIINPVENQQAALVYDSERLIEQRQAEIADFNDCLKQFGITFSELAEISPKHVDSRQALFSIGYILSSDAELMRILIGKKMLPIKELMQQVDVSRKTLERNRKFIIAIALIHSGPYPCLKEYLQIPSLPRKEA